MPNGNRMKFLILMSLVHSQNLLSRTPLATEDTSVKSTVSLINRIDGVVSDAARPGTACKEEQVSLPRDVVDVANKIDESDGRSQGQGILAKDFFYLRRSSR